LSSARAASPLDAATEAGLLAEVRAGGPGRARAFDAIFRALREPVLALCLHLTGRRADAEDALQETFLSVHRALPGFRGEARLASWIYRIALREALHARAARRDHGPVDHEVAAPGGGEGPLVARDEARRVQAALVRLTAEQRAVLALFALEGLSHRQVAEILGIPEGTVWSRLHVARRRLAAALQEPAAGAGG
jgi:RNA polymerase sigma-70 factor (ECF subfamily)